MITYSKIHLVNDEGEIIETFENGGQFTRNEEIERRCKEKEKRQRKEMLQRANGEKFVFVKVDESMQPLPPETVTKLVFLSTYSNYEGVLMLKERKKMQRKDIAAVLNISDRAASSFWAQVKDTYIRNTDKELLLLDTFKKGKIRAGSGKAYQKIWVNGIRALYNAASIRQHKQLGYVFKMLPYINIEYNILCWNPTETELEMIDPMSFTDFAEQIGYDITHKSRLMAAYNKITFEVEGIRQLFCNVTFNPEYVIINPRVIYEGTHWEKVEILGVFCK